MESVERTKRRSGIAVHVSFHFVSFRFVSRRCAGQRTCHRRYHLPRVIPPRRSLYPYAISLHPPPFLTAGHGARIFRSFYLYRGRMHKYSRACIFRSNETYEKCKILSTRSILFSHAIYSSVYTYIYIYIYRNIHSR